MNELKEGQRFSDFDEFAVAVNEYGIATNAVFTTLDSKRNGRHQYLKLACKHYGNPRSKSRGIRPLQKTFKQNCPVFVYAKRMEGCVTITRLVLTHENHECDPVKVSHYPERRQLDKYEKQVVETLVSDNIGPSVIRNKVRKLTGKPINAKDMVNLRYKLQRESMCEVEDLICVLVELLQSDQDAVVTLGIKPAEVCTGQSQLINLRIFLDSDSNFQEQLMESDTILSFVFIQLGTMQRTFAKYPDILIMNNAYSITGNGFPLTICMALDDHGSGRVISYMVEDNAGDSTTASLLNCLKQANPGAMMHVRRVVLDKDPSERANVLDVLPDHVTVETNSSRAVHALKVIVEKLYEYTQCIDDENAKDATIEQLESIVYAKSEEEYIAAKEKLLEVAPESFSQYFLSNWDSVRETWVLYEKLFVPISDPKVERESAELKTILGSCSSFAETVRSILQCHEDQDNIAFEQYDSSAKLKGLKGERSPEMEYIEEMCTPFAAKLLSAEILAMEGLQSDEGREMCPCAFNRSLRLPCRHIFLDRKNKGEHMLTLGELPMRWLKRIQEESMNWSVPSEAADPEAAAVYAEAMGVARDICRILSERDDAAFEAGLQTLKELRDHWLAGNDVVMAHVSMSSADPAPAISTAASEPSQPPAVPAPSAKGRRGINCHCGELVARRTVTRGRRKGEQFYSCARRENRCSFVKSIPETSKHHALANQRRDLAQRICRVFQLRGKLNLNRRSK